MILRGGKSPQVACGAPEIRPLFVAPHSDQHQSLENFSMPTGDGFRTSPVEVYFRLTGRRQATRPAPPHIPADIRPLSEGQFRAAFAKPRSSRADYLP